MFYRGVLSNVLLRSSVECSLCPTSNTGKRWADCIAKDALRVHVRMKRCHDAIRSHAIRTHVSAHGLCGIFLYTECSIECGLRLASLKGEREADGIVKEALKLAEKYGQPRIVLEVRARV